MSHSDGAVRFVERNEIYYCEYNGTVDVMLPKLFETYEQMRLEWRSQEWKICEDKSHIHEEVEIASSYGGGFSWIGTACWICKTITDNHMPHDHDEIGYKNDLPEWFPDRKIYKVT